MCSVIILGHTSGENPVLSYRAIEYNSNNNNNRLSTWEYYAVGNKMKIWKGPLCTSTYAISAEIQKHSVQRALRLLTSLT